MKPIEPDGGDAPGEHPEFEVDVDVDKTFRRLAQAQHASEDFYAQVMARAAELPSPRQKRGMAMPWQSLFYPCLPRAATVALASVLLLCMAGLGYLYHRVGQMQAVVEQQQVRQHQRALEVARLRQEHTAPQPCEGNHDLAALSQISLEFDAPDSKSDDTISVDKAVIAEENPPVSDVKSIFDRVIETLRWAFEVVWEKLQGVLKHHPSPADPQPRPSQ